MSDLATRSAVSDVCLEARDCLHFGAVGGGDAAGDDQVGVQVTRDVALVAVESLGLALAPVTHVLVLDRYPSVFDRALTQARFAVRRLGVQVLLAQLPQGRQRFGQRRL